MRKPFMQIIWIIILSAILMVEGSHWVAFTLLCFSLLLAAFDINYLQNEIDDDNDDADDGPQQMDEDSEWMNASTGPYKNY